MVEEDAALVEWFEVGDEGVGVTIDEAEGGSHVEEETVADEFGGLIIDIRTRQLILDNSSDLLALYG